MHDTNTLFMAAKWHDIGVHGHEIQEREKRAYQEPKNSYNSLALPKIALELYYEYSKNL